MRVHVKHLGLDQEDRIKPGERIEFIGSAAYGAPEGPTCACGLVTLGDEPAWTSGRLTHGKLACYRIVGER